MEMDCEVKLEIKKDKIQHKNQKIKNFDNLIVELSRQKSLGKKIIHVHGVFDLLHIGHIRHFDQAKQKGDILVVSITKDKYVNKGPHRPCFNEQLRAEAIAALHCTDYVVINRWPTAVETIKLIKPHLYVKGDEYQDPKNDLTAKILDEIEAVRSVGGDIDFTNDITFSSSALLNQFFSPFSDEVITYLNKLKKQYSSNKILGYLENAKEMEVLVIGEAIIDIYHFSDVIGKSGKEPILVTKHKYVEHYLGGALAVANHLADFCKHVTCLTYLGEKKEYEEFIRQDLKKNVELIPVYKKDSPTIVKRRYMDEYLKQKLFEVYEINDDFLDAIQTQELVSKLDVLLKENDLVIAADYGHGLLDTHTIQKLCDESKFLSVNTQSNAGNYGFNCISKYPKANYVCIANRELQLTYHQRHFSVFEQLTNFSKDFNYDCITITSGKKGLYVYKQERRIHEAPAFNFNVVDRVGSGDAVLAITSLCAAQDAPSEIIGFIGNVVGAEAVGIMGNKNFMGKIALMKHIDHLLK
ncbi:MAG: hypothetical protein ACD_44C00140G0004 [uncultured bacterium]|nr:MAG: hypothetical protein ACD_44C00140G0004 [uncultured bacterium]